MQRGGRGRTTTTTTPLKTGGCDNIDEKCGTVLFPGDLTFTGFDNDIAKEKDYITITTLVTIVKNTSFIIANALYEAYALANQRTDKWYDAKGKAGEKIASHKIVYIGEEPIKPGTNICFHLPSEGSGEQLLAQGFSIGGEPSKDFCVSNNGYEFNIKVNLESDLADALFLMQGDWTFKEDHATFCGRILSGLQIGAHWFTFEEKPLDFTQSRRSRVPFQIECFAIQAMTTPTLWSSYYQFDLPKYSPLQFLALATNFENWTTSTENNTQNNLPSNVCTQNFSVV